MARVHTTLRAAPQPDLFTFAFVRHPLTWYQSYYCYKRRAGWDPKNTWDHSVRADSFEEFLSRALRQTPGYYSRMLRQYVGRAGSEIEFIGRFENLVEDLSHALRAAGESFDPRVLECCPPINQSDYASYPARYSKDFELEVLAVEAEAIERFFSNESQLR